MKINILSWMVCHSINQDFCNLLCELWIKNILKAKGDINYCPTCCIVNIPFQPVGRVKESPACNAFVTEVTDITKKNESPSGFTSTVKVCLEQHSKKREACGNLCKSTPTFCRLCSHWRWCQTIWQAWHCRRHATITPQHHCQISGQPPPPSIHWDQGRQGRGNSQTSQYATYHGAWQTHTSHPILPPPSPAPAMNHPW